MKKLNIVILLLICFSNINLSSQKNSSGIVYYESKINGKELDKYLTTKRKNINRKGVKESLDKVFLNTTTIKSKLKFFDYKGIFKVTEKLNLEKNELAQKVLKTVSGGSNTYYYNEIDKIYLIKECIIGECFIFDNKYLEWQLTQETRTINGYVSYKATRSNGKVIAWYTPSIPISFGPKGEYGLPGLILELEVGKIIFKATKIVLNPKEEIKVEEPTGGKRVSYEEYAKEIKKAKKSVFGN
ncbi:GLPGLI family protein [Polaribacter litorisediminis]|uniref:GLPGLI family protein n=1 Tax=Polaribacter litorisediminis TaxID=1908341 RepID=UPI001CC09667|nr:GLPGLI family protein [Polaribacter litorisediminis]UAM97894.1 GLPGLI family protein [Polaribacter litorisediminis]